MENVQLFILYTQFVNVSSVFNKQAALPQGRLPIHSESPDCVLWNQGVAPEEEG